MTPENFLILKFICRALAGFFGILIAVFTCLDVAKDDKHEDTRAWFKAKWQAIKDSRWLSLPERAIYWFLDLRINLTAYVLGGPPRWLAKIWFVLTPVLAVVGCLIYARWYVAVLSFVVTLPIYLALLTGRIDRYKSLKEVEKDLRFVAWFTFSGFITSIIFIVTWLLMALHWDINYAAPAMIGLLPFFSIAMTVALGLFTAIGRSDTQRGAIYLFLLGIALGFTTTFLALLIGHVADPQAYVPQTFQMLASNIIFDGLTMVVTFAILSWAMQRTGVLRIPVAILLDLLAAAVLACASLYFGLVFTAHALTIKQLLHILVARSLDGARFELSPYFWAMHTTFMPTLAYLLLILLCWLAKIMLSVAKAFFGKGQEHKHPLKLTAALCAIVAAIFVALGYIADDAKQLAEQKLKEKPPVVSTHQ